MILHKPKDAEHTREVTGLFHADTALCRFRCANLNVDKATADAILKSLAMPRSDQRMHHVESCDPTRASGAVPIQHKQSLLDSQVRGHFSQGVDVFRNGRQYDASVTALRVPARQRRPKCHQTG